MREWPVHTSHFQLPMRYFMDGEGPGTVILLHGYQDHALSMTRRMGWWGATDLPFRRLSVNAPFPVPIWKSSGFIEAYSWYFRDTSRNLMIVNPRDTAAQVANLVRSLLPADSPIVLFGFSQGGILAPFLAAELSGVRGLIAVGSGFPEENYKNLNRNIRVHAIHGEYDDRWPLENSKSAHQKVIEMGFHGEFHLIPGLDHRVDISLSPLVTRLALQSFGGNP